VSGRRSPSQRAAAGIAARGNMNPESRMFGIRNMKPSCIACVCVRTTVEMSRPIPRFATMKPSVMR
jgi:hypothetical protein